ncbi:MAG TPA: hypothetical protein VEK37_08365, partial [Gemmatimonadaceae bacterium]|nr:hypothetical protein [Gemmatimonadaceae bacterium]
MIVGHCPACRFPGSNTAHLILGDHETTPGAQSEIHLFECPVHICQGLGAAYHSLAPRETPNPLRVRR